MRALILSSSILIRHVWIHAGFHHFMEIGKICHSKNIFSNNNNNNNNNKLSKLKLRDEIIRLADLQGFMRGEWNWPISCLNDSETHERDSMSLEPPPPPPIPWGFWGFWFLPPFNHSCLSCTQILTLRRSEYNRVWDYFPVTELEIQGRSTRVGINTVRGGLGKNCTVIYTMIIYIFTSNFTRDHQVHYLLHSTLSLRNRAGFWKGQLALVQD